MNNNIVRKLDKDGYMYYMDYTRDYYDPRIIQDKHYYQPDAKKH